jgi:uncharacterized protein YecE (DUF72 family)
MKRCDGAIERAPSGAQPFRSAPRTRLFVGTSGWVYPDWVGPVYPRSLRGAEAFAFYAKHFDTVELNSTFYHFPRETTVEQWQAMGGEAFAWSVKAWRRITHIKRLKGIRDDARRFLTRVEPLAREGVVLFQLPPSSKQDLRRLEGFLKRLPASIRAAIEFRHNSWFAQDTYRLLAGHRVALVGVDAPGIQRVLDVRTAPFAYFRFHGSSQWYRHRYSASELKLFARAASIHLREGDLYAYFDNTADGHAFHNALAFRDAVQGS